MNTISVVIQCKTNTEVNKLKLRDGNEDCIVSKLKKCVCKDKYLGQSIAVKRCSIVCNCILESKTK